MTIGSYFRRRLKLDNGSKEGTSVDGRPAEAIENTLLDLWHFYFRQH
jgi:hypothetical protein